jgi:hypothetical protein
LSRIPAELHRWGAKAALQLHHAGRETFEAAAGATPEAPSAIPSAILDQPCEAMSLERIAEVIDAFAKAAARAREAGFDAVQLHQFLDTVFPDPHALGHKFFPDPGPAVFAFAASVGCFDVCQHGFITQAPARL